MNIKNTFLQIIFLFFACSSHHLYTQIVFEDERGEQAEEKKQPRQLEGYVKYEFYGDSRQVIGYRADQNLLSPEGPLFDIYGKDINQRGQFMQNAIETRLRYTFSTEHVKGLDCKATAVIEADFFGLATLDTELAGEFRFRHAYIQLETKHITLLMGHFWNPTTILDCYPDTISFNGGAPYEPSSRNPLITCTINYKNKQLILGAISQLNFTSDGPDGFLNKYARDGILPEIHFQVKQKNKEHTFGAGYEIKRLAPRLVTNDDVVTHESIISHMVFAYYSFFHEQFSFCTKYAFCQNGTDYGVFGGYGVHSINPANDKRTYSNIASSNFWIDIAAHLPKDTSPGLFFGYMINHGSSKTILHDIVDQQGIIIEKMVYGLDSHVGQSLRIQPRVRFKYKPLTFGLELEITATSFGNRDNFARIHDARWEINTRILGALFYLF